MSSIPSIPAIPKPETKLEQTKMNIELEHEPSEVEHKLIVDTDTEMIYLGIN
jgi:hypothetical protein